MRARLMMKLMGVVVMLVLTLVTAHSCRPSPASSPLNPDTVLRNGVAGLCANQQAAAAADGTGTGDSSSAVQLPAGDGGLAEVGHLAGVSSGSVPCPTTTLAGP
jgi:hypothetical protein